MTAEPVDVDDSVCRPSQQASRWLIAIVAIAIVSRVLLALFRSADLNSDPDAYVAHARNLVETGTFSVPGTNRPTAFRPPVYPVLLAGFLAIGVGPVTAVTLINLFASTITVIATWWIARVVGLRRRWPGVCAAGVAFDPILFRYSVLPMTEVVASAFLSVAVLQTLKLITDADRRTAGSMIRSGVAAGFCFGLGGLCRPILFVACAAVTIGLVILLIQSRSKAIERPARTAAGALVLPALVAGLVLQIWVIRNAIQFHEFVPATTHGGYTLLLGNNRAFYREVVNADDDVVWSEPGLSQWQEELRDDLSREGVDPTDEVATDRALYRRAKAAISEAPWTFVKACLLRCKRFWAVSSESHSGDSNGTAGWMVVGWYVVVFIGMIVGLWILGIRRDRRLFILILPVLAFFSMHTVYWTNARMRAPVSAMIYVLAVTGWQWLLMRSRSEQGSTASATHDPSDGPSTSKGAANI